MASRTQKNLKTPPVMRDDLSYKDWKSDIEIWSDFTDIEDEKKGGAVFLTLTGKAQQTVRAAVTRDNLKTATGLKNVLAALDALYLKDELSTGFAAFEDFTSYRRPVSTSVQDFMVEFNIRSMRCEQYDMKLPDGVLAYYLLKCANLTGEQTNICKATCDKPTLSSMTTQIKRVTSTGSQSGKTDSEPQTVTVEAQYYGHEVEEPEVYYGEEEEYEYEADGYEEEEGASHEAYYAQPSAPRRFQYRPGAPRRGAAWTPKPQGVQGAGPLPRLNTPDEYGNPTRCSFCRSTYHYVGQCPDAAKHGTTRGRGAASYRRGGVRSRASRGFSGRGQYI